MPSAALERHPDAACDALRGIAASVTRNAAGGLQVAFVLDGEIERLRIPAPRPARVAEGLWRHTCCEIFIARRGAPGLPGVQPVALRRVGRVRLHALPRRASAR